MIMEQNISCFRSFESMTHVFMDMTVKETAKSAFGFTAVPFYVIVNKVELVAAIVILWHISSHYLQPHYLLPERNTCYEVFYLFMIIDVNDIAEFLCCYHHPLRSNPTLLLIIVFSYSILLVTLVIIVLSYHVLLLYFYHHLILLNTNHRPTPLHSTCISLPSIRAVTSSAAVSHLH